MLHKQKKWIVLSSLNDNIKQNEDLIKKYNLHPVAWQLLQRRGLDTEEKIDKFLNFDWETGIYSPFLLSQMQKAVDRIFLAIKNKEHIVIHGDYDADGVTGSTVLADVLKKIISLITFNEAKIEYEPLDNQGDGKSVFFNVIDKGLGTASLDIYIPHRENEGYGLNLKTVDFLKQRQTNLLITVDCGIVNIEEIKKVKDFGIDTIVVDHHQFETELPEAILIHPGLPNETYPFKDLAAVGVAWKVAQALLIEARKQELNIPIGYEKWLLDLVSIATVTDIVPLKDENRVLEFYGLKVMNKTRRAGCKALIEVSSWNRGDIDSQAIGFVIGPRINAAGRMEHAFLALDLLLEDDYTKALEKAKKLERINRDRQKATELLMKEAEKDFIDNDEERIIVAWNKNWSPSLVGLAAGRFADRFGKPALFIGQHNGVWVGSGRSIKGYHITEALKEAGSDYLLRFGGHPQACGFSLEKEEDVVLFAKAMQEHAKIKLENVDLLPVLEIEKEIVFDDLDWRLVDNLALFEPFGEANPKPIFISKKLKVVDASMVGAAQNHLRALLESDNAKKQKFIGFYKTDLKDIFKIGNIIDVVYEIGTSEWNGRREIQCKIISARLSE